MQGRGRSGIEKAEESYRRDTCAPEQPKGKASEAVLLLRIPGIHAGCERDRRLLIDIVGAKGHAPIALHHPTTRATEMVMPQEGSETFMARHLQHAKQRNNGGERRRGSRDYRGGGGPDCCFK